VSRLLEHGDLTVEVLSCGDRLAAVGGDTDVCIEARERDAELAALDVEIPACGDVAGVGSGLAQAVEERPQGPALVHGSTGSDSRVLRPTRHDGAREQNREDGFGGASPRWVPLEANDTSKLRVCAHES